MYISKIKKKIFVKYNYIILDKKLYYLNFFARFRFLQFLKNIIFFVILLNLY